jgi:hypothetical protein
MVKTKIADTLFAFHLLPGRKDGYLPYIGKVVIIFKSTDIFL